jgi:hypothetical protein
MIDKLRSIRRYYTVGKLLLNNPYYRVAVEKNLLEVKKGPGRTIVINYLLSMFKRETLYLEIGVRNPDDNYNLIKATTKYSVDPGLEFKDSKIDFNSTSDSFFEQLNANQILSNQIKFDIIFIDGLHYADQVDRDIRNSMNFLKDDGFIVLHDCNPPTEWHARQEYSFSLSPAQNFWNGTTWKAFLKWRYDSSVNSCCVDTDWGVGILSKKHPLGKSIVNENPFYEFNLFDENRIQYLNLISFDGLKDILK